jgi:hypothetical protein
MNTSVVFLEKVSVLLFWSCAYLEEKINAKVREILSKRKEENNIF